MMNIGIFTNRAYTFSRISLLSGAILLTSCDMQAVEKPLAADWLSAQVDDLSKKLYVYSDYSDSRNAFTQRGVTADLGPLAEPQMNEASSEAFSGITSIKVTVPVQYPYWSGYYFGNGVLDAGATQPVFHWGTHDAGMDLRGAVRLRLHARAEKGAGEVRVNFFVGGIQGDYPDSDRRESGYVTLTDEWKQIEISLAGADLSRINGGFGWVTNAMNNPGKSTVTFYLDEIYYEFAAPRNVPVFLPSYASVPLDKEGYFINSTSYSYDVAMAAIALSYAGKHAQARKVADGLLFALYNDRKFTPDQRGIRNGYAAGNPASFPGWRSADGKTPFARLAGFFNIDHQTWYEDYYSCSFSTGNNAWAIIALLEVGRNAPEKPDYVKAACDIADYIHTLKMPKGFSGGWEGFDESQRKATYSSTEHCIDIYSAFRQLADHIVQTDPAKAQLYKADADHARAFVHAMYNPQGFFYTGTKPDGESINYDVQPLDVNTWGLLAFHRDPGFDISKIYAYLHEHFAVQGGGYDFNQDHDCRWNEGTCQVAAVADMLGDRQKYQEIIDCVMADAAADGSITAASCDGLTTGIYLEGVDANGNPVGAPWVYDKRRHTGATAWLSIAQSGRSPLPDAVDAPPPATALKALVSNGTLHLSGIRKNASVCVYTAAGQVVYCAENKSDPPATFTVRLPQRGVYVVSSDRDSVKVIY